MKKILFSAIALTAVAFTSCDKNEEGGNNPAAKGQDTYVTVSISDIATRANGDVNATAAESTVKKISLFFYDANGNLLADGLGTGELAEADISATNGTATGTKKIKTSTAAKTVVVGVNFPTAIVTAATTTNKTIAYFKSTAYTTTVAAISDATNGFMMSGIKEGLALAPVANETDATPSANNISTDVQRFASKVVVYSTLTYPVSTTDNGGVIADIKFRIENVNTKMYLAQKISGTKVIDPNWSSYNVTDFTNNNTVYRAPATAKAATGEAYAAADVEYILENTEELHYTLASTSVTFKTQYKPLAYMVKTSGNWGPEANPNSAYNDFYVLQWDGNIAFFETLAAVTEFKADYGITATEKFYDDGVAYYFGYLANKQTPKYDVLRNKFYEVNVKSFRGLGSNSPVEPFLPIDDLNAWVELIINVAPWSLVSEDWDL